MAAVTTTNAHEQAGRHPGLISMLVALGLLSSCTDILEPSPEVNNSIQPPSQLLTTVAIRGYQPGKHVAGSITLTFDGFPTNPKPALSTLTLSPSLVLTSSSTSPSFTFPANGLPDGALHILFTRYADRDPSFGLLNLFNQEEFVSATRAVLDTTIPLIVDHQLPTDIQKVSMNWPWHPTISWSANTDPNFQAYFIRRLRPTSRLDTVFLQSRTSFTDTTQLPYLGEPARYTVSVWNGAVESAGKETSLSYGTPWPHRYNMYALIPSPITDEAYGFLAGDTLEAISTSNTAILRTKAFTRHLNGTVALQGMTPDGSVLYWFDPTDNTLNRYRASDFSAYPKLSIPPPDLMDYAFLATTRRVFEVTSAGSLICIDATTGNSIGGTVASYGYGGAIASSPDEKTLYGATGDSKLYRFDVSADSFAVTGQSSIPGAAQKIVPIGKANAIGIYIRFHTACVVDERSLALLNTITSPDIIWDACFTSTHAYVSTGNSVIEYDLRGGPTGRRWLCPASPDLVAVDRNEAILYAEVYGGGMLAVWAVPLL